MLEAQAVRRMMQLARSSALLDRLRVSMGLPLEFHLVAVLPVVEGYAGAVCRRAVPVSGAGARLEVEFFGALERAIYALALRRGRILPPHVAPEEIGERTHRWTYGVFVAALLLPAPSSQGIATTKSHAGGTDSLRSSVEEARCARQLYQQLVPSDIQHWLQADPLLVSELELCLASVLEANRGTLGVLMDQAQRQLASPNRLDDAPAQRQNSHPDESITTEPAAPTTITSRTPQQSEELAWACTTAQRFMNWVIAGVGNDTLTVNEPDAVVHFVGEGMLLVSPRIFKDYARTQGPYDSGATTVSVRDESRLGMDVQRQVLRAGWHVRAKGGINIQTYDVVRRGKIASTLHGVLIRNPERFLAPVPPANPMLVRRSTA